MSDPRVIPSFDEILAIPGCPPAGEAYGDITFAIVVWNDADRLARLLEHVRPYFRTLAVVVQDSPDATLNVARDMADVVASDAHHGYGDASFGPVLLPLISAQWTFKVDADEWPSASLLESLGVATWYADRVGSAGLWIPFRSWVEGGEYKQDHSHLRLFHTRIGWPSTLHSRPPIEHGILWNRGHIAHVRSLDEMMQDYLNYYRIGRHDVGWEAHNREMMYHACRASGEARGWDFVRSFPWWDQVKAIAFAGVDPEAGGSNG